MKQSANALPHPFAVGIPRTDIVAYSLAVLAMNVISKGTASTSRDLPHPRAAPAGRATLRRMRRQAGARIWGRPRSRSGIEYTVDSPLCLAREDARVGAAKYMHREDTTVRVVRCFDPFGGIGKLYIPKFPQVYHYEQPPAGTMTAEEWFEETLTFDTRSTTAPTGAALQKGLEAAWDALDSPGKGGKKEEEIPTFTENHDWLETVPYTTPAERERRNRELCESHEGRDPRGKQPEALWSFVMRLAALLLCLEACSLRHSASTPEQGRRASAPELAQNGKHGAPSMPPTSDAGPVAPSNDAGAEPSAESRPQASDDFLPTMPPGGSEVMHDTTIWAVIDGKCEHITFSPRTPTSGSALMLGYWSNYEIRGARFKLKSISYYEGVGIVSQRCDTEFRIGPGLTLGGADVYRSQAACEEGLPTAVPLDDSAATTLQKCWHISVPVMTNEVTCFGDLYAWSWQPGCITAARDVGFPRIRTK